MEESAAFFVENEFQDTGYYVYRFYKASFGRQPNYTEFTSDRSRVIGGSNLEANKQAFADEWVQHGSGRSGYNFWLDVVNNREPNNYGGMVCSFITSTEYQLRFGSAVTRSNADCRQ